MTLSTTAFGGPKVELGPNQNINFAFAFRGAFTTVEDAAPSGTDWSKDFTAENTRLYVWGQAGEHLGYTFNLERDSEGDINILDAIAQWDWSDGVHVWVGRFLPPADRAVLEAPLFPVTFNFPFVHAFPAIFAGRVEGAMFWGTDANAKLHYSVAAYDGREGGSNQEDNVMYSARVSYDFWDGEPGYYPLAWYDGAKKILAVGGSVRYQKDGAGTAANPGDFLGWNVDARLEQPFSNGSAFDAEAAYYNYDLDDKADASLVQGDGYYVSVGYKLPGKFGIGQIEPRIDWQSFDRDDTNIAGQTGKRERLDVGFRYLIKGHNIRVDVFGSREDPGPGLEEFNSFTTRVHMVF